MRIKTGDTVIVITGKDKGATGKVLRTYPKDNRLIVEGVNVQTKHQKQTRKIQESQIMHIEGPIDASNVMLYDTKSKKPVKIGYQGTGKDKVRVNRKTGAKID